MAFLVDRALVARLPSTLALLESGKVDWYRASKVVEATTWLSDEDAAAVDVALASRLAGKNPTQVRKAASHAAYRRIDRFARALKTWDESRTLAQLRADVAMDLLLGGTGGKGGVQSEVFLYMDMNTYLGLNNDPVEMAGHGHLPAALAQYLASGADTVLRRIITDPLTGQVMELGRTR